MSDFENEKIWQLQDAKAKFSEFIRACQSSPQIVSVRGENKAVMMSIDSFEELQNSKPDLRSLLNSLPFKINT